MAIIGSLVAVTVNLWKWFNKESEEVKALRGEQEELIKTTDEMAKKMKMQLSQEKAKSTN
ncbi:hypothetical protein GQR36_25075 [Enterococcus termitis]